MIRNTFTIKTIKYNTPKAHVNNYNPTETRQKKRRVYKLNSKRSRINSITRNKLLFIYRYWWWAKGKSTRNFPSPVALRDIRSRI